jgi:hypothetical protein
MAYTTKPAIRKSRAGVLWAWVIGLAAVIVVAWLVIGMLEDDEPRVGLSVDDVVSNIETYAGSTVTVSGEVEDKLAGGAFTLSQDTWGRDKKLLVVGGKFAELVREDDEVRVTGEVRRFMITDVERDLQIDLDDDLYRTWHNRPVMIARSVDVVKKD